MVVRVLPLVAAVVVALAPAAAEARHLQHAVRGGPLAGDIHHDGHHLFGGKVRGEPLAVLDAVLQNGNTGAGGHEAAEPVDPRGVGLRAEVRDDVLGDEELRARVAAEMARKTMVSPARAPNGASNVLIVGAMVSRVTKEI